VALLQAGVTFSHIWAMLPQNEKKAFTGFLAKLPGFAAISIRPQGGQIECCHKG